MFSVSHKNSLFWAIVLIGLGIAGLSVVDHRISSLLWGTASVAVPVTLLTLVISSLLATLLGKTDVWGRSIAILILGSVLLLPLHQVVSGWLAALGYRGWFLTFLFGKASKYVFLEGQLGAILVHTAAATPWATGLLAIALRTCHRPLEEQALLEVSPLRVLWKVTWRQTTLAFIATALLIAISCATEIAATDLFQVRTFAEEIYTQASLGSFDLIGKSPWQGLLGVTIGVGLQALVVVWALNALRLKFRSSSQNMVVEEGVSTWIVPLKKKQIAANALLLLLLFFVVLIPFFALLHKGGIVVSSVDTRFDAINLSEVTWQRRWSLSALIENVALAPWEHRRELLVSCLLGVVVASTSVVVGGLFAWRLREATSERMRLADWPLMLLLATGVALPGPLVGLITIRLLNQPPESWFAPLGDLYGTWFAPWFVQMVRIVPLIAMVLWPAAVSFPGSLLEAAKSDGAGWVARLLWIVLPARWPVLVAAWFIAFGLSLGELSATILVVPPGIPPLSVRLLSLLHYGVEEQVAAISLCLIAGYAVLILIAMELYRKYKI